MAEKKLFNVQITIDAIVLAKDAAEAEGLACDAARDGDLLDDAGAHAIEMRHLPEGWTEEMIPFGLEDDEDPDRTIGEWIKLGAAPAFEKANEEQQQMLAKLSLYKNTASTMAEGPTMQAKKSEPEKP